MKEVVYNMNTTNLDCDAVYDIVMDDIYRTLVGPIWKSHFVLLIEVVGES